MNKLIIIGNGFDLAHDLKTRYSDFMLWYVNKAIEEFNIKNIYTDVLMEIHRAKGAASYPLPKARSLDVFIKNKKNLRGVIEYDFKSLLNRLFNTEESLNWVDIESTYYDLLKSECRNAEQATSEGGVFNESKLKQLNEQFKQLKDNLKKYLSSIDCTHVDRIKDITKLFREQFHFNPKYQDYFMFLNFNYTSTLDMYLQDINSKYYHVNYIHGRLTDKQNPIIFGYGDEIDHYYQKIEDLNCNTFLENFKSFGYLKTKNYQHFTGFLENGAFEVHILGHSCGLSDRVLFRTIVEHDNCNGIEIHYHKKSEEENDYLEKTFELSRHFSLENKGLLRERVVPFDESHPLVEI